MLSAAKHLAGLEKRRTRWDAGGGGLLCNRSGDKKMARRSYYVYLMANESRMMYTGVTNNLERRVSEHSGKMYVGFMKKYNIKRLVYYEEMGDVRDAIAREKQIKGWLRSKKVALIESLNPQWRDLSEEWFDDLQDPS